MPSIDPPRSSDTVVGSVFPLPSMHTVDDYPLAMQVRRLGGDILVRAELHSPEHESSVTVTLPRMKPGIALQLAKALIEAVTGAEVDAEELAEKKA